MLSNKYTNKKECLNNCWLTWRITQRLRNKSQINTSNTRLVLGEKIWSEADVSVGYSWEETHFTSRGFETKIMTTLKARIKTQMNVRLNPRSVINCAKRCRCQFGQGK